MLSYLPYLIDILYHHRRMTITHTNTASASSKYPVIREESNLVSTITDNGEWTMDYGGRLGNDYDYQ